MPVVVLANAGGVDSAMVAAILAKDPTMVVHSLFIDVGAVNSVPCGVAAAETARLFCADHKAVTVDFGYTPNYWKDDEGNVFPYDDGIQELSPAYFHGTANVTMVTHSLALSYARMVSAEYIYSGTKGNVAVGYVDDFNVLLAKNTRLGEDAPVAVMPFVGIYPCGYDVLSAQFDIDLSQFGYTYSCHWATPCGVCGKCTKRVALGLS